MGNRVTIQFVNKKSKSVILYDHVGGMELVHLAKQYAESMKDRFSKLEEKQFPLERLEPSIVMVDFISKLFKGKDVIMDYRLFSEDMKLSTDNGHHLIKLD